MFLKALLSKWVCVQLSSFYLFIPVYLLKFLLIIHNVCINNTVYLRWEIDYLWWLLGSDGRVFEKTLFFHLKFFVLIRSFTDPLLVFLPLSVLGEVGVELHCISSHKSTFLALLRPLLSFNSFLLIWDLIGFGLGLKLPLYRLLISTAVSFTNKLICPTLIIYLCCWKKLIFERLLSLLENMATIFVLFSIRDFINIWRNNSLFTLILS